MLPFLLFDMLSPDPYVGPTCRVLRELETVEGASSAFSGSSHTADLSTADVDSLAQFSGNQLSSFLRQCSTNDKVRQVRANIQAEQQSLSLPVGLLADNVAPAKVRGQEGPRSSFNHAALPASQAQDDKGLLDNLTAEPKTRPQSKLDLTVDVAWDPTSPPPTPPRCAELGRDTNLMQFLPASPSEGTCTTEIAKSQHPASDCDSITALSCVEGPLPPAPVLPSLPLQSTVVNCVQSDPVLSTSAAPGQPAGALQPGGIIDGAATVDASAAPMSSLQVQSQGDTNTCCTLVEVGWNNSNPVPLLRLNNAAEAKNTHNIVDVLNSEDEDVWETVDLPSSSVCAPVASLPTPETGTCVAESNSGIPYVTPVDPRQFSSGPASTIPGQGPAPVLMQDDCGPSPLNMPLICLAQPAVAPGPTDASKTASQFQSSDRPGDAMDAFLNPGVRPPELGMPWASSKTLPSENYSDKALPTSSLPVSTDDLGPSSMQMIFSEVQAMLTLFGIPYIAYPGEADAQCGSLSRDGVVDAVVTEDSDVMLFGANAMIKNFFGGAASSK
eukprot:gene1770-457_t